MLSNPATNSLQRIKLSVRGIKAVAVQGLDEGRHGQGVDNRGAMGLEDTQLSVYLLKRHGVGSSQKFAKFLLMPFAFNGFFNRFNLSIDIGQNSNQKPNSCRGNRHLLKQPYEHSRATHNVNDGKHPIYSTIEPRVHVIKLDAIFYIKHGFKMRSIVLDRLCHNLPLLGRVLRWWGWPCWTPCGRNLAPFFCSSHGLPHVGEMLRGRSQHFDTCRYDHLITEGGL